MPYALPRRTAGYGASGSGLTVKAAVAAVAAGPWSRVNWSATWPTIHSPWPCSAGQGRGRRAPAPGRSRRGGRGRAVVADLAVQHLAVAVQPQPPVPGAVADGVGGQLVRARTFHHCSATSHEAFLPPCWPAARGTDLLLSNAVRMHRSRCVLQTCPLNCTSLKPHSTVSCPERPKARAWPETCDVHKHALPPARGAGSATSAASRGTKGATTRPSPRPSPSPSDPSASTSATCSSSSASRPPTAATVASSPSSPS
jgi:hypothetical protein